MGRARQAGRSGTAGRCSGDSCDDRRFGRNGKGFQVQRLPSTLYPMAFSANQRYDRDSIRHSSITPGEEVFL